MTLSALALVDLTQAKNFLRIDAAISFHINAEYVGAGDGDETHFPLDHAPVEGSLELYLNNVLQTEPTNYSIVGMVITFVEAPTDGYPVTASYDHSEPSPSSCCCNDYVGVGDNNTKVFNLSYTPIEGSLELYVDDVLQIEVTDYTIDGVAITFVEAPHMKDIITAIYCRLAPLSSFESYEDNLLERLIEAATKKAEDYTGRAFVQGSITESHNGDGSKVLRLYKQPVVSVSSVSYKRIVRNTGDGATVDFSLGYTPKSGSLTVYVNGILQTEGGEQDYTLSGQVVTFASAPADDAELIFRFEVSMALGSSYFEQIHIGRLSGSWLSGYEYVIAYTAGYAFTRALAQVAVPDAMLAVLLIISDLYENRGDKIDSINISGIGSTSYKMPSRAEELLRLLRTELC